ncbi:MAG: XkdX family protein [Treponema sp.]|jgi:diphthamide biosynthesis methyltransferase|nr:XkdX family protein [Treponema sp.]
MSFELIKQNYKRGLWTLAMVQVALDKGVITQAQFDEIVDETRDRSA